MLFTFNFLPFLIIGYEEMSTCNQMIYISHRDYYLIVCSVCVGVWHVAYPFSCLMASTSNDGECHLMVTCPRITHVHTKITTYSRYTSHICSWWGCIYTWRLIIWASFIFSGFAIIIIRNVMASSKSCWWLCICIRWVITKVWIWRVSMCVSLTSLARWCCQTHREKMTRVS